MKMIPTLMKFRKKRPALKNPELSPILHSESTQVQTFQFNFMEFILLNYLYYDKQWQAKCHMIKVSSYSSTHMS